MLSMHTFKQSYKVQALILRAQLALQDLPRKTASLDPLTPPYPPGNIFNSFGCSPLHKVFRLPHPNFSMLDIIYAFILLKVKATSFPSPLCTPQAHFLFPCLFNIVDYHCKLGYQTIQKWNKKLIGRFAQEWSFRLWISPRSVVGEVDLEGNQKSLQDSYLTGDHGSFYRHRDSCSLRLERTGASTGQGGLAGLRVWFSPLCQNLLTFYYPNFSGFDLSQVMS